MKSVKNKFLFKLFARFIGIDASNPSMLRKTFESILKDFLFKTQLKSALKNDLHITDNSVISTISKSFGRSDCPGLWLRNEIQTQLLFAGNFKPSNEKDLDHIQYLPYVDLLLADKAMVEMTTQVLRSPILPENLKKLGLPIKASKSLKALETVLFG